MPAVNLRQAMVPEGAEDLQQPSRHRTLGLWLEDRGRMIALLPGPPRELKPLFLEEVFPRLQRRVSGVRMVKRELRVTGLGESHVEERIRPIYTRYADVNTTILASPGEIQIHLRVWTEDIAHAEIVLDEMVRSFELALGDRIFTHTASSLEEVVGAILADNRATISAAGELRRRSLLFRREVDANSRKLELLSWWRGLLSQRTEERLGRCFTLI